MQPVSMAQLILVRSQASNRKLWSEEHKVLKQPWRIVGQVVRHPATLRDSESSIQYANLERWFFEGIGTTTYTLNSQNQLVLWSQQDTDGPMSLTDRCC